MHTYVTLRYLRYITYKGQDESSNLAHQNGLVRYWQTTLN